MGLEYKISNAAHKYGLDNMAVTPALEAAEDKITGDIVSTNNSWGSGAITVGQVGVSTSTYSGGFSESLTLVYSAPTTGVFTALEVRSTTTNETLVSASGAVPFTTATYGVDLQTENIFSGNDHISGNSYNNILFGGRGDDRIEGGGGTDTVVLTGLSSQYHIVQSGTAINTSGPDGADSLINISRLQFDDKNLAYDISGVAGQAYRLYQAAFDRKPDAGGLGFWIKYMDAGLSLNGAAASFMSSAEFISAYGSNPSDLAYINHLYQNVLHRPGEQAGIDFWLNAIQVSHTSRAEVLGFFAESPENQAAVIGSIQNGISYTPYGS